MVASSIARVIQCLDEIIDISKKQNSRMGFFASMYRRTTLAVQQHILNNSFEDAQRMERLDVVFANRYLEAWEAYVNNRPCTNSWCTTFDACSNNSLIVLQHLILGMNTHINLDLAISAAQVSSGQDIFGLERDFVKINDVIASISQHVQDNLAKVWFPLKALQKLTNDREEPVLNFSIKMARKTSWASGVALAMVSGPAHQNYIAIMDDKVVQIAKRIISPGWAMSFILKPVRLMESKNVGSLIDILES